MIVLVRVDEKLIHGQVVVGWGSALELTDFVVVDDAIAADDWERELVLAGVPDGKRGAVHTVSEAAEEWPAWADDVERRVVLVEGVQTLVLLADAGIALDEVNVGGLRKRPGRREFLQFVQLDEEEYAAALGLCERGVRLEGRDMPGAHAVDVCRLLRKALHAQP